MPLEKITQRILSETREEARQILVRAQAEADKIAKSARDEGNELKKKILAAAQKEAQEEKTRLLSLARLEARNLVLREMQAGVESVFQESMRKILSLPTDEYRDLTREILLKEVVTGNEEIIVSLADKDRINADFIAELNALLESQSKKGNLRLAKKTRDINGGFILKSEGIETNNSFVARLTAIRQDLEAQVLKILLNDQPH